MWEGVIDSGCDGLTQGTVGGVERKRWSAEIFFIGAEGGVRSAGH
jgi:hypothetical protein